MFSMYGVAAWAAALCAITSNVAPAWAQTKITVGVAAMSPRTIPLIIAQEQGLFAKQGIEARVVLIKGAPILVASLSLENSRSATPAAPPWWERRRKGHT